MRFRIFEQGSRCRACQGAGKRRPGKRNRRIFFFRLGGRGRQGVRVNVSRVPRGSVTCPDCQGRGTR